MNTGILDINPSVTENYLDILHGKTILTSKAVGIRSEMFDGDEEADTQPEEIDKILNSIDIIPVRGPVQRGNILNRNNEVAVWGMDWVAETIMRCANDPKNVAIVLEFETGGGYSNSVASVIAALTYYKSKGKKSYASVDMACSAGFHIAIFCDRIYANSRSSVFGCMGTKWEGINSAAYDKKMGFLDVSVTSQMTPDKNREFSEAINGNPQLLLNHLINPIGQHFFDDVKINRPGMNLQMMKGATVAAAIAIENGMADGIMSITEIVSSIISKNFPSPQKNSVAPTNSPNSNLKPKNTMTQNSLFGWFTNKLAGTTTPEMDGQALRDISELDSLKSSYGLEKQGFQDTIVSLQSALDAEKIARSTDATTILDLQNRLDKTVGAPPKTPVGDANNEIIPTSSNTSEQVPGLKDAVEEFNAKLNRMVNY